MSVSIWDLHVHASPSSSPRWGNDLDLIQAASEFGLNGFVLKSHHEPTAARAMVANDYAARIGSTAVAAGSITLNPWTSRTTFERAIALGARMIWWPTSDVRGRRSGLRRPRLHDRALAALADIGGVAATGHLAAAEAAALIEDGAAKGIPVVVTHPFNPDVGVGAAAARELGAAGGIIEVDAFSLCRPSVSIPSIARTLLGFRERDLRLMISSDGGQSTTGNPVVFLKSTASLLERAGFPHVDELHATAATLARRLVP